LIHNDGDLALLVDGAARCGILLSEAQLEVFARYRELLLDWNTRVNLTAITAPQEVVTRHFLDSLTCLLAVPEEQRCAPAKLIDIGSGAGFPGLPLAIVSPNWQVTLLEATGKKVRFLEATIAALELGNVVSRHGRAEEMARDLSWRGSYELATARAVASLPTLLEFCSPFLRTGGLMLMPKKGVLTAEIAAGRSAAPHLGARLLDPVPVPFGNDGRVIIPARQERPCPPLYPRAAGAPVKHPLR
jgi:16S rRNA (guanine527-N7)-methyltransferase